jgi:hypothetical protein
VSDGNTSSELRSLRYTNTGHAIAPLSRISDEGMFMSKQSLDRLLIIVLASTVSIPLCYAQAPSLQEQLNAQYKLVHIGADGSVVGDPGTLLSIQKGGIIAVPWKAVAKCPAKFHDNDLHPSTGFCANMMKNVSAVFRKGAKVYPIMLDVDMSKSKITFQVVRCDSCYSDAAPSAMKGEVVFEFAKGYLEKASAGEVEDTIGQVFAISSDDQGADNANAAPQPDQQTAASTQSQPAEQAEPATVQMGMTTDQVESILGKPDKLFNVGTKQIYVYKDVKVTFLNGKVSDVQ